MHPYIVVVAAALALAPSQPRADFLDDMVEAERAFARTAAERGIRDAFLAFFSTDSIALTPEPVSAVEGLRSRPSRPFSEGS
jgi:hypothetical protein